jgi:hypothetical protein
MTRSRHCCAATAATEPRRPAGGPHGRADEAGVALVLTLIFSILLYVLVAELVVSGSMIRATGENDAMLARMRNQMLYQLADAEEQLLTDMAGQAEEGGEGGPLGGALGGAAGAGAPPGGGTGAAGGEGGEGAEGEEADPAASCESSRDSWFQPVGHADNDLTTYVWIEDESRKFNLLALWSPDEKFADLSKDRFVRLLDALREDSDFDVTMSDAERIAQDLLDWSRRPDTDMIPRPRLKSDDPNVPPDFTLPLHLDELLLLPSVTEDLFFDKVLDGKVYLGLESVLTIWTSLRADPGNPEKVARQRAEAEASGEQAPGGAQPGPAGEAGGPGAGTQGAGSGAAPGAEGQPVQPDGQGIRINVNTASYPVLRALFPPDKIPDRVIEAIVKYRNEEDEEETEKAAEEAGVTEASDFGDLRLGSEKKLKFFGDIADLEEVEEFANLPDPQVKTEFKTALTTRSDVFSIHLATLHKRNEENRVYLLRRARSIVLRYDDGGEGRIVPLVPFEDRSGLRLMPVDLQEDNPLDLVPVYLDLDQFAQEDRAWNPFYVDFYLPKQVRNDFYAPR